MKTWEPDHIFDRADFRLKKGKQGKKSLNLIKGEDDLASRLSREQWSRTVQPIPVKLLQKTTLSSPDKAIHLLRSWFWEKSIPSNEKSGLRAIAPNIRIFAIFTTLGDKIVQYLFQIMSPAERKRMADILKSASKPDSATTELICNEYIKAIRKYPG